MVRKIPCFCTPPKSTRMSSTTAIVEFVLTRIVDWNELMTHASSALALPPEIAITSEEANAAIASLAARTLIGSPYIASCRP